MDSALVVSQIVLVTACITALVTLEFLFFGLVVMSFFMPVQPCFTLEDLKAQLTLPLFALPKIMLSLHVPLIWGGIDFDLAQFTLNFDNLELSYWSRTPQSSFSGCHSVTVYGLDANSISLIYFSLLLLSLQKHALERKNCIFYSTSEFVKSNERFVHPTSLKIQH